MGMKKTEIGMIPEDWDVQRFSDIFRILNNNTYSRAELNYDSGQFRNIHYGDVLILFPEVLDCTREDVPYINDVVRISSSAQSLQDGDIVMADTAEDETVGKVTEVTNTSDKPVMAGLHTIPCRVKSGEFTPSWLGYYMNSNIYHKQLLPFVHGIKVSSIAKSSLGNTIIVVPPIHEQEKIVSALQDIDGVISKLKKLIAKEEGVKKASLDQLFPNHNGDTPCLRMGGYKEAWKSYRLEEVISEMYNGQTPSRFHNEFWNGDINWLSSGELNRGHVIRTNEKITEKGRESSNLRIVPKGTFVIAITGLEAKGTRGNCAILDIETTINQSCMALIPDPQKLDVGFLYQWYRKVGDSYGITYTQGTKQQSYNVDILRSLIITLPSIEEQREISEYLNCLDKSIELHKKELKKNIRMKQGMMEELLTGKVRLI